MTYQKYHARKLHRVNEWSRNIMLPPDYWRQFVKDPKTDTMEVPFRMIFNDKFLVMFPADSPEDTELAQKFIDSTCKDTDES